MADAGAPETLDTEGAVKSYYGKSLSSSSDLKTSACTTQSKRYPKFILDAMKLIHDEVKSKYYGCGPVFPPALEGAHILDLGSGSGQDCYALSKLVGQEGFVMGLDMTDEQLNVANKYVDYHTEKFNYSRPNVQFVKGNMEKMEEASIESNKFDIIVSNCVINLAKDKRAVLSEAFRVLKDGGELYFSDVYADRDLPPNLRDHEELWCECVVGALWWKNLYKLAKEIGFSTPRLVSASIVSIDDKSYKEFLGDAKFVSVTYSLFKLPATESSGTSAQYNGTVEGFEQELPFCDGITFKKGEFGHVKQELACILQNSRYKNHFTFSEGEKGPCKCSKLEKDPFEYCAENGIVKGSGCCS